VLRRQLELYIAEQYCADRLSREKNQTELRGVKKELSRTEETPGRLETRKAKLETAMRKEESERHAAAHQRV
jgi:hypothetical protein